MKYILYLLAGIYILWWIYFINTFFYWGKKDVPSNIITNIEKIKQSIVIIVPEEELISYKNNPKWLFEEDKTSWIWAGFFISKDWKIQTVNHIVENNNINYKIIYNNKEYNSKIISRNKEKDLAIITIITEKNITYTPLKLTNNYKNNDYIYSYWIDPEKLKIIYNTWIIINKKSKLGNITNLLEISNILKPGFSGWPIINNLWDIIWINYAISNWKNYWISF
jgi:serine protease Do